MALALGLLRWATGCGSPDQVPDPRWVGEYRCVKDTDSWRNPTRCTLFEEGFVLDLHGDGSLAIEYSNENLMSRRFTGIKAWMITPATKSSNGRWWTREDELVMELDVAKLEMRGDRRIVYTVELSRAETLMRETNQNIDPGWKPSPLDDAFSKRVGHTGFVLADGSEWISRTEE